MDFKTRIAWLPLAVTLVALTAWAGQPDTDGRGRQFIGFDSFGSFVESAGGGPGEKVLTSPELPARSGFTELILSWNAALSKGEYLLAEARAVSAEHWT